MVNVVIACGFQAEADRAPQGVTIVISGGDPAKLAAGLDAALDAGCTHILVWGTCGALAPDIRAGTLVTGYSFRASADQPDWVFDYTWSERLSTAAGAKFVVVTAAGGTLITVDQKTALRASTAADVVDLEVGVAVEVALRRGVPCAYLRAVSDEADETIPPAARDAITKTGSIDAWLAISGVAMDVTELPAMIRLGETSAAAFESLRRAASSIGTTCGAAS